MKKCEHPGYLDFVLILLTPEITHPLCISEQAFQREDRFKSKLCMGLPRHLICNKRAIPLKWKCGHVEGEQACNLHSLMQTPQEPGLWGCACCLTLETGSILQGRWMVCVASAAQGMLGQHMEGSWQLCVAALEEPGNKGEKYRLKKPKCTEIGFSSVCIGMLSMQPLLWQVCFTVLISLWQKLSFPSSHQEVSKT